MENADNSETATGDSNPRVEADASESARLAALVSLIADASPTVREATSQAVMEAGRSVLPHLEQASDQADARRRVRARLLLVELRCRLAVEQLEQLRERFDDPRTLERATVLLAQTRDAGVQASEVSAALDGLAADLAPRIEGVRHPRNLAQILRELLVSEWGFRGNVRNYYDLENSYIDRVLDRRLGIPVTLGAICLMVTRRVGLELRGLGGPGRFLVQLPGDPVHLIDPFRGGAITQASAGLRPMSDRDILVRMIGNLQLVHRGRGDVAELKVLHRLRRALEPGSPVARG